MEEEENDRRNTMFEMHRKTLSKALLNYETVNELQERKMSYSFGPKMEYGESKSYHETQDEFMQHIDHLRSHETYKHENCSKACADRGCKFVLVIDGNWKLRYPICMFNTEHAYPSELTKFLPNVCTEAPLGENAFCKNHCSVARRLGIPAKLSEFIAHCGANPKQYNAEGKSKIALVLKQMADAAGKACSIADTQNTAYSWVGLVLPYTEELISRPFVGENRFRLVFQDSMGPKNAIGCLDVSAHLLLF